jgi:hypothetical protein
MTKIESFNIYKQVIPFLATKVSVSFKSIISIRLLELEPMPSLKMIVWELEKSIMPLALVIGRCA